MLLHYCSRTTCSTQPDTTPPKKLTGNIVGMLLIVLTKATSISISHKCPSCWTSPSPRTTNFTTGRAALYCIFVNWMNLNKLYSLQLPWPSTLLKLWSITADKTYTASFIMVPTSKHLHPAVGSKGFGMFVLLSKWICTCMILYLLKKKEKRANQEGAAGSRALWFPLSKHSM
jgi:hypothetical protein